MQPKGVLAKQIFVVVSPVVTAKTKCVQIAEMSFYKYNIQLNSVSFISLIDIFTPEREVSLPEKASVNKLYLGNLKWV